MVRDPGKSSLHNPEALFSATEAPLPSSPLFWTRLLTQRPWMLLGGLWLVLVCMAAVASHRLLFTDPANARGATPTQSEVAASRSGEVIRSAQPGDGRSTESDPAPGRRGAMVVLWGMSSLVGICALGSFVISQQAKASARRRPKRRVRRVKPKAKVKAPTGPKRLQPYSPDRDAVIVKGAQAVKDTLPLSLVEAEAEPDLFGEGLFGESLFDDHSADTPQSNVLNPPVVAPPSLGKGQRGKGKKPRPPRMATPPGPHPLAAPISAAPAKDDPTTTEVLPQDEAHPLDWTEDSLAHTLDLRQRRSLSSLM